MASQFGAFGAGHILHNGGGISGNMFTKVARDGARIDVEAASGFVCDNKPDGLPSVKRFLSVEWRADQEHRLAILQKPFLDTLKDPEFLTDAKKAKLDIAPIDGAATAKTLAGFYDLDAPIVAKLKKVLLADVSGRETPQ